ncbi:MULTISPECIES: hypothetical protein [unclassified Sedimentibacter]|uniref:hypothetical protein n=1 Tax=unclassified Sedimentibacter TaxID=2649220 RepID=UPI0027E1F9E5|nr:hypothetical protein [Sedimentibacter sp. MB35-C1]WMJ77793.1 hypothetical protein RBQ61_02360 [Sedimentibacter sp. MB35-C1]
MGYDDFKNKICMYYNSFENTKNKVESLKSTLNNIVTNILPQRDSECLFLIRDFKNTSNLNINFIYHNMMCYYSDEENALVVGVVCPNWSNGWKNISKNNFISKQIDILFHFISQYIYRSYQINMIGAIALSTDIPTDFRGNTLKSTCDEYAIQEIEKFKTFIEENTSELSLKTLGYLRLINALDPFINKSIFYYTRSLELYSSEFTEEALTAADNMVDVIFQSIKNRINAPTQERKEMCKYVYKELKFYDETDKHNLERLYLLRCRFTAHPSKSKWWDFYEIYEDDIEQIKLSVRKLLIKYLKYENKNRLIDAHPTLWSQWFIENCDIVYDAVWFHEIP